jgi:hypothetical protein
MANKGRGREIEIDWRNVHYKHVQIIVECLEKIKASL